MGEFAVPLAVYNCCILLMAMILGILMVVRSNDIAGLSAQPTNYLNQVVYDWQTVPFVNITVTDETSCPKDTELVLQRDWYGMQLACDCLFVWDYDISTDNEMVLGTYCDYN